jgi:hypothetical protein
LESRNQQVTFFRDFVKKECHQTLTSNAFGHAFGIEASHGRKIRSKADKKPKPPYWHAALDEDQTGLHTFIPSGYSAHISINQGGILGFIKVNYGQCLTYQWMASVLKSHDRLVC